MNTQFTTEQVWREARTWVGTPYRHHGRIKGDRCDCVGLIVGVGEFVGLTLYTRFDYSSHPKAEKLLKETGAVLIESPWRREDGPVQLVAGEVVAMCVGAALEPQHLGIVGMLDNGSQSIIHAFNKEGRVVEHTLSKWWASRIIRVYRYPNVIYPEGAE